MNYNDEKITCSVAVATYKRPELLSKLISSLIDQKVSNKFILEIIIVDNDEECSAKNIVENFIQNSDIIIKYFVQPIQNISITRNIALEKSAGKFIVIIDDDETADKKWILELIKTAIKYEADAVFGYVEPIFPPKVSQRFKQRELYFQPMGSTGDYPLFFYTTNCLIRKEFIVKYNLSFDPKYGLSGGEDGVFFETMNKLGAKLVVCREAITYEIIPEYRATHKFIFRRFYQRGNNYGRFYIESNKNSVEISKMWLFIKSIIAIMVYGFGVIFFYPNKKRWIFYLKDFALNIGKISALLNFSHYIYKD